jgi:uncharacterized protein
MQDKLNKLKDILRAMHKVIVAYSGGVDSTVLLKVAYNCLGERTLAMTAVSPTMPKHERAEAKAIAQQIGARHIFIEKHEMDNPQFTRNTPERCYFCKRIAYKPLIEYANREGYAYVVDGANADDAGDYRPGQKAAREWGVRSPLQEAGFTKAEIRALARELHLPNWDKPAAACLASRIPYGMPITEATLSQIEAAEQVLREMELGQLRVRHYNQPNTSSPLARIEVEPKNFETLLEHRAHIIETFKALGYTYITLDLEGFRSGSMNEGIIPDGH